MKFTGINIQYPISQLIMDGSKVVETRTYPLPKKFEGVELLFVETPGKAGEFNSRIVGKITFSSSFEYKSKAEFQRDIKRHRVEKNSTWDWTDKPKWGWVIEKVELFKNPKPVKIRLGIKYTNNITL